MPSDPKDLWEKIWEMTVVIFMFYHRQGGWLIALLRLGEEPAEVTANVSRPRKIYDKATLILIHGGLSSKKRGQTHTLKKIFSDILCDFFTILQFTTY